MGETLHALVSSNYSCYSDRIAIIFDDGTEKLQISYGQLDNQVQEVSSFLSRHDVKGCVVGVCVQAEYAAIIVCLGILNVKAGFYIFEAGSVEFVLGVLDQIGIAILVLDHYSLQGLNKISVQLKGEIIGQVVLSKQRLVVVKLTSVKQKRHHGNLAYCITTSGTTGTPKVVRVPHRCIVPNILAIRKLFYLTEADVVFLSSPLTFDPSVVEVFSSLSVGACIVTTGARVKLVPNSLLDVVFYRNPVTVLQATPSLVRQLDPSVLSQTLLSQTSPLRVLSLGGERFPSCSEIRRWRGEGNKTVFFNLYGTTEVSCWAMYYQLTEEDIQSDETVPLGTPLTDTMVKVVDLTGTVLTAGSGQLLIGGDRRQCILSDRESTWYNIDHIKLRDTGDNVQLTSTSQFLYQGRTDDQVKRNGKRLNLTELDQVVLMLDCVQACCSLIIDNQLTVYVILSEDKMESLTDMDQGRQLLTPSLTIEEQVGHNSGLIGRIHSHIKGHLPDHYLPDTIRLGHVMPLTSHGKVDKTRLSEMLAEPTEIMKTDTDINTSLEQIWKTTLNLDSQLPVLDTDMFVSGGGNSLQAVQFVSAVELSIHRQLPELLDWVLHKTFGQIKQLIHRIGSDMGQSLKLPVKRHHVATSEKKDNVEIKLDSDKEKPQLVEMILQKGTEKRQRVDPILDQYGDTFYQATTTERMLDNDAVEGNVPSSVSFGSIKQGYVSRAQVRSLSSFDLIDEASVTNSQDLIGSVSRGNRQQCLCGRDLQYHLDKSTTRGVNRASDVSPELYKHKPPSSRDDHHVNEIGRVQQQGPAYRLEVCWKYNTDKCVDASPLLAVARSGLDCIYIGSHSHRFSAISMATGQLLWEQVLGDRVESSACLSSCSKYVIVGCYDGNVYTLNATTGEIWWKYQTGGEVKSSPVVDMATGFVYVGSHSHNVYALNVQEKQCVWSCCVDGGSIFSSPVVSHNTQCVYAASLKGSLVSLNTESGKLMWKYSCGAAIFSSPCVTATGVCVGCVKGNLYFISHSGQLMWKFSSDGPIFSSPSVVSVNNQDKRWENSTSQDMADQQDRVNCVMFGSHDGYIYCLTLKGDLQWKVKVASQVYSTPFSCYLGDLQPDSLCCCSEGCYRQPCSSMCDQHLPVNTRTRCLNENDKLCRFDLQDTCHRRSDSLLHCTGCDCFDKSIADCDSDMCSRGGIIPKPDDTLHRTGSVDNQDSDTSTTPPEISLSKKTCKYGHRCSSGSSTCGLNKDEGIEPRLTGEYYKCEILENTEGDRLKQSGVKKMERAKHQLLHQPICDTAHREGQPSFSGQVNSGASTRQDIKGPHLRPVVVFASTSGIVYMLDGRDGQLLASQPLPGEVFSSPVVRNDHVVVGCRDNYVYCLNIH